MGTRSRTIQTIRTAAAIVVLAVPFLSACIAFLPSATSKSEEERKWFLLNLIDSPEQNALISSPPTVSAEGYDPALFTVNREPEAEAMAVPIYGKHFVSVGQIYDIDVDTSKIPGAPEEYQSVFMPPGQFAEITYQYDERLLRERGLIEEFQVYYYDKGSGRWFPVSDVEVDLERNTVTARTNHFTPFVLTALPQPADDGVFPPPQCIVDALDDPAGSLTGPVWSRLDAGFKYYLDRGYTIVRNDDFYNLRLNEALGIATCNGGTHSSSNTYCGPQGQHKFNSDPDYLDFAVPFDAKVYVLYDSRGTVRANWLADMGFTQVANTYVETTDEAQFYEVYETNYAAGSQVTLPGNHYNINNPNQIRTNYFVAVLPEGDWATQAGIDCSGQPLRPPQPEGIRLIPGSDQISIVFDQTIERDVTGLIVRRRLQEPAMSPATGEAVGLAIEEPGYIIDIGLTEGTNYHYSFFAVTDDGLYSAPLILDAQTGPDNDGDGLADYYENHPSIVYYGGNGTDSNMEDTDSDGIDDLTEVINLTDPTNSDHTAPVITAFEDDGTVSTTPVARFNIEVDDTSAITGWYLSTGTEPPPNDSTDWLTDEPSTWAVEEIGELTLNLWVRDAAGNVSDMASLVLDFPNLAYSNQMIVYTPQEAITNLTKIDRNDLNIISIDQPGIFQVPQLVSIGRNVIVTTTYDATGIEWSTLGSHPSSSPQFNDTVFPAGAMVNGLQYSPGGDFWLLTFHGRNGVNATAECPMTSDYLCLTTFRLNSDNTGMEVIDRDYIYARYGATGFGYTNLGLSVDGKRFTLLYIGTGYILTGSMENGIIKRLFASNHLPLAQASGNEDINLAHNPSHNMVAIPADPYYAGVHGIQMMRFNPQAQVGYNSQLGPEWDYIGIMVRGQPYFDLAFVGEDRLLALRPDALVLFAVDTVNGSLTPIRTVWSTPSPGTRESMSLLVDRKGSVVIIREDNDFNYLIMNSDTGQVIASTTVSTNSWNTWSRVAFNLRSEGNQPPRLGFALDRGTRVLTPQGWTYPFSGIYIPGRTCADTIIGILPTYSNNSAARWGMARITYSDPDANKCGVSNLPVNLTAPSTTSPSPGALETAMTLYNNIVIEADSPTEMLIPMQTLLGPVGKQVCPNALLMDGTAHSAVPFTPKEPGDYSVTVEAQDSAGSCEGPDQTARATLHLKARNQHVDGRQFFVDLDEYPQGISPLRKLNLKPAERSFYRGVPGRFEKITCTTHMLACGWIGREYGSPFCINEIEATPEMIVDAQYASCGSQAPRIPYWHANATYQYDGFDFGMRRTYYKSVKPAIPLPAGAFKKGGLGFIFLKQDEKRTFGQQLYGGNWIGYEDL